MGNRVVSPLVPFPEASAKLGRGDVDVLRGEFRHLSRGSPQLSKAAFHVHVAKHLGMLGRVAADRLFDTLDSDKSGFLSFEQWVVGVFLFSRASDADRMQLMFSIFDQTQSGYLNVNNLAELLLVATLSRKASISPEPLSVSGNDLRACQPLIDMMVETTLARFDADNDGKLSLTEFMNFVKYEPAVADFERQLAAVLTRPLARGSSSPDDSPLPSNPPESSADRARPSAVPPTPSTPTPPPQHQQQQQHQPTTTQPQRHGRARPGRPPN